MTIVDIPVQRNPSDFTTRVVITLRGPKTEMMQLVQTLASESPKQATTTMSFTVEEVDGPPDNHIYYGVPSTMEEVD